MLGSPNQNINFIAKAWFSGESITGSFDTAESFSTECWREKQNTLIPSENKHLFQNLSPEIPEYYENLYERLVKVLEIIEEAIPPVNVGDDCSICPKNVSLRLPDRRRTVPPKFS